MHDDGRWPKAKGHLSDSRHLKRCKDLQLKKKTNQLTSQYPILILDDVPQFAIVTGIDKIGVPNEDMENAYRYRCVRKLCDKVSQEFDIHIYHVVPVSSYFEEVAPNIVKNNMSLYTLWRVFTSGIDYIEGK